jgi:hypothetical protein
MSPRATAAATGKRSGSRTGEDRGENRDPESPYFPREKRVFYWLVFFCSRAKLLREVALAKNAGVYAFKRNLHTFSRAYKVCADPSEKKELGGG